MAGKTEKLRKRLMTPVLGGREKTFRVIMLAVVVLGLGYLLVRGVLDRPRVPDSFNNSYSPSPGGHLALARLLEGAGLKVDRRAKPLSSLGPEYYTPRGSCLALLEPNVNFAQDNAREFGPAFEPVIRVPNVVLVLPKRYYVRTGELDDDGAIQLEEGRVPIRAVNQVLDVCGLSDDIIAVRTQRPGTITSVDSKVTVKLHDEPLQVFSLSPDAESIYDVLMRTDDGQPVVIRRRDGGSQVLVSDPDLIASRFLDQGRAADLAVEIFKATNCISINIDESMHGLASSASLEYLAATPPGLWLTLSVFLLLLLFGWREATVLRPGTADTETRRSRGVVIEGVARTMGRARDYAAAATALLRRAHVHLGAGPVAVQASGMAGSTATGLSRDKKERLEAVKLESGQGPLNLITAAQVVAQLTNNDSNQAKK